MTSKINEASLSSICLQVVDCPHATPKWTDSGFIVLRNQNIKGGRLDLSAPSYTDEEHYLSRVRRTKPQAGDIVITREAPMGDVCQIPIGLECCLGQRQVLLRPNPAMVDGRFLLYALQSPYLQNQISWNEGTGSTVSNLRIPVLEALKIPMPSLRFQKDVAETLGALDDQIDILHETNATLEAIAQALYKSWFIEFDPICAKQEDRPLEGIDKASTSLFPDSFEKSELGDMPKGWQICNLGDISYRHMDKIKDSSDWANLPLIDLARLNSKQLFNESYGIGSELNTSVTRFEKGDLLFGAIRPYFHKVSLAHVDGVTNVSVLVIRPKKELSYAFLANLLFLDTTVDFAVRLSKGTKMPVISWADLSTLKIILPPESIMESFNEEIKPLIKKGLDNATSIQLLTEIRDTLLPRLISGQLRLPEAENLIEAFA